MNLNKKNSIRQQVKLQKSLLDDKIKGFAANAVFSKIEDSLWFKDAHHILTYSSLPDELQSTQYLNLWKKTKSIYLPRVNQNFLEILPATQTTTGAFNIDEPIGNNIISTSILQLIIVPGIAFDLNGTRIGRGKGFYDRLLNSTNALKIGVGYDFQLFDSIPSECHDVPMDAIITPNNTIILNKSIPWQ